MPQKDQAYDKNIQDSPQKSIRNGFFWIGTASAVSQALTALAMLIAMIYLSDTEMGIATLALAFSAIFEAFNALGTNEAILQDSKLTPNETHSVFWFATFFGIGIFLISVPLAWPAAYYYNAEALIPLFIIAMLKLPLVSIAAIPLQLINRRFEFQKIGAINVICTLTSSIVKIVLAFCGCGAWALVIGDTAYGLITLFGAFAFSHYQPQMHFSLKECKRFVIFGIKHCIGLSINTLNKNLHYLIIGRILGSGPLGVYRIAYELAMTPALALFDVVNKSSYPIFARLQEKRSQLTELFHWNQRNIAIFSAIPLGFIIFASADIFNLFPKSDWLAAIPIIPFVLILSFIRAHLNTYPSLYRACGKPEYTIYVSGIETILFLIFCTIALYISPPEYALESMTCVWILILIGLIGSFARIARKFIDISFIQIIKSVSHGLGIIGLCTAASILPYLFREYLPWPNITHLILETLIIIACVGIYSRYVLKVSIKELIRQHKKKKSYDNNADSTKDDSTKDDSTKDDSTNNDSTKDDSTKDDSTNNDSQAESIRHSCDASH